MQPNTSEWPLGTAIELFESKMVAITDAGIAVTRRFAVAESDPLYALNASPIPPIGDTITLIVPYADSSEETIATCRRLYIEERMSALVWVVAAEYAGIPREALRGRYQSHFERAQLDIPRWRATFTAASLTVPVWDSETVTIPQYREVVTYTVRVARQLTAADFDAISAQVGRIHSFPGAGNTETEWLFQGADTADLGRIDGTQLVYSWTFDPGTPYIEPRVSAGSLVALGAVTPRPPFFEYTLLRPEEAFPAHQTYTYDPYKLWRNDPEGWRTLPGMTP